MCYELRKELKMVEQKKNYIYEVAGLSKEFDGRQVLCISSLTIEKGRIYCFYGGNGSGKTTLFEILTLLKQPESGRIYFKGKEVYPAGDGYAELRSQVTLIHQNPLLFDTTVEKNVDYGLRIRKIAGPERKKHVEECLEFVGLGGFQRRKARELSGGEGQRVAIARALAIEPEVIFMDEFSANIDSQYREAIENIIRKINKHFRTTIIFTTHYMDQAYRLADKVVYLYKGKIAEAQIRNLFHGTIRKEGEDTFFENDKVKIFIASNREGVANISIPPNIIIVSKNTIVSSMRNCLKGKISHIIDNEKSVILRVCSGEIFEVVIMKESFCEMGLKPGENILLNFKATSVEIL